MSRAFIKDLDEESGVETLPELPQSPHPNYVTRRGLRLLHERLAEARARQREVAAAPEGPEKELHLAHLGRDIRHLEGRIERAILVEKPARADEVAFGAQVEVVDAQGHDRTVAIVGEDEADAEHGRVSWVSPLARALIGARVGDVVSWRRPAGEVELEVRSIRYPSEP